MHIELLESRIAPAGIVTITQTANDLRFAGDEEANAIVLEDLLVSGVIHVEATAGTMLRFGDQTGTSFDIPLGARKNIKIDLGAGDDELTLRDIALPGNLDVRGGAGNNTVTIAGLMEEEGIFYYTGGDDSDTLLSDFGPNGGLLAKSVLIDLKGGTNFIDYTDAAGTLRTTGVFQVLSGDGNDTIDIHAATGRFGGFVAKLGGGANATAVTLENTMISSYVLAEGGAGADSLSILSRGDLTIRKTLTTNFGDGAAAVEVGAAGALTVTGKSSFTFGRTAPSPVETASVKLGGRDVKLGPMTLFSPAEWFAESVVIVSGYVDGTGVDEQTPARSITGGAMKVQGASAVVVNATNAVTVRGSIGITSDTGAEMSRVAITAASVDIGKDFTFTDGAGDADVTLAADSISIGGKLALNLGDTATHEAVSFGLPGGTFSAGSVTVAAKTTEVAIETLEVVAAGRFEVAGPFSIVDGGRAASIQFAGVDIDVGKAFTLALGEGDDVVDMNGGSFDAQSFVANLGAGVNTFGFSWGATNTAKLNILGGASADVVALDIERGVLPAVQVNLGSGANVARVESSGGLRIGKLSWSSDSGESALLESLRVEGAVVKEIAASFGAADSLLAVARSRVGKLVANLGAGADTMRLDDNLFTGAVTVNTGLGNDSVRIECDVDEAGESIFLNRVIFTLSDGDDEVLVADATDETKASFRSIVGVYGDAGTDTFTPHATNATFATPPVLTGIP